jgi:hypothetical protein
MNAMASLAFIMVLSLLGTANTDASAAEAAADERPRELRLTGVVYVANSDAKTLTVKHVGDEGYTVFAVNKSTVLTAIDADSSETVSLRTDLRILAPGDVVTVAYVAAEELPVAKSIHLEP